MRCRLVGHMLQYLDAWWRLHTVIHFAHICLWNLRQKRRIFTRRSAWFRHSSCFFIQRGNVPRPRAGNSRWIAKRRSMARTCVQPARVAGNASCWRTTPSTRLCADPLDTWSDDAGRKRAFCRPAADATLSDPAAHTSDSAGAGHRSLQTPRPSRSAMVHRHAWWRRSSAEEALDAPDDAPVQG